MSIHKKGDKQTLRNYCPVSLLPFAVKFLKDFYITKIFGFFLNKGLISANQLGFKLGDSCINVS